MEPSGPRWTLLVVDDDPDLRDYMRRTLERLGDVVESVREASTGRAALALVRAGGIDGLVTDVRLPDLDGIDLSRRVEEEAGPLPVLLVSGESSRTGDAFAFAAKAKHRAFLAKPFNASQLTRAVLDLFEGT